MLGEVGSLERKILFVAVFSLQQFKLEKSEETTDKLHLLKKFYYCKHIDVMSGVVVF